MIFYFYYFGNQNWGFRFRFESIIHIYFIIKENTIQTEIRVETIDFDSKIKIIEID